MPLATGLLSKGMDTEHLARAADGTPIFYRAFGPPGGRPLLFVHGLASGGAQFAADAAHFAAQGYRVLVPDVRGHGRSGKPEPMDDAGFSIPTLADDLLCVLDHAGEGRVDWVGNSLGGILALDLMGRVPERLASVAFFGTAFALDLPPLAAHAIPLTYRLLGRRLAAWLTGRMTVRGADDQALVSRLLLEFDPLVGRAIARHVRCYDLSAAAEAYGGPMLILRGGLDRAVNLALDRSLPALARRPNVSVVHLPEGGHCANLDVPEAFRGALAAFWAAQR